MEPTRELIEALDREEILDAKRMTPSEKLVSSGDLFDYACTITLSGIKAQYPGISEQDALEKLRRRLEFARQTETRA